MKDEVDIIKDRIIHKTRELIVFAFTKWLITNNRKWRERYESLNSTLETLTK